MKSYTPPLAQQSLRPEHKNKNENEINNPGSWICTKEVTCAYFNQTKNQCSNDCPNKVSQATQGYKNKCLHPKETASGCLHRYQQHDENARRPGHRRS